MYTCLIAGNNSDFVGKRTKKYQNIVVDAFLIIQSAFLTTYVSCSRLTKCILIHYIFVCSMRSCQGTALFPITALAGAYYTERNETERKVPNIAEIHLLRNEMLGQAV